MDRAEPAFYSHRAGLLAAALATLVVASPAWGKPDENPADGAAPRFRQLAPGTMTTIPAETVEAESRSIHDIVELLRADPTLDFAKSVIFRHKVWTLEFRFKPVRMIAADVLTESGRLERKLVWYMVYRVRNVSDGPVRFVPTFSLESLDARRSYPSDLLPGVVPLIREREDPARPLLSTVEITGDIPPTPEGRDVGVWGVVTWQDIDPGTDRFRIFLGGLSNAYRWEDLPEGGRTFTRKTLQLEFWRPGDEFDQHEEEIRFGDPDADVDYRWVYR